MNKSLKRKLVFSLMTLQVMFVFIFLISFVSYSKNVSLINIGLDPLIENGIIMCLSILSMMNIIYELKGL